MPVFFWMCFGMFGGISMVRDEHTRERRVIDGVKQGMVYEQLVPGRFRTDDADYIRRHAIAARELARDSKNGESK